MMTSEPELARYVGINDERISLCIEDAYVTVVLVSCSTAHDEYLRSSCC